MPKIYMWMRYLSEVSTPQHGQAAEIVELDRSLSVGREEHDERGERRMRLVQERGEAAFGKGWALESRDALGGQREMKTNKQVERNGKGRERDPQWQSVIVQSREHAWHKRQSDGAESDRCTRTFCWPQVVTKETQE